MSEATVAYTIVPFPENFPHKGEFIAWDRQWNRTGYRADPQYSGAQPIRYPEDATLLEIQLGGYIRLQDQPR